MSNAGRRGGSKLALGASWAKTRQGGKESKLKAGRFTWDSGGSFENKSDWFQHSKVNSQDLYITENIVN